MRAPSSNLQVHDRIGHGPTHPPKPTPAFGRQAANPVSEHREGSARSLLAEPLGPRFALVLGSGGVRSIAALGMAEVLMRERMAPDLIVGCSAGAIFGALVAAGHAPAEAVRLATTLWSADITRRRRWRAVPQMLWPRLTRFDADFALRDDGPVVERLQRAFGDLRLEQLRTPLRVTATDSATGEGVVLQRGSVVQALRAAVALPFMFSPGQVDGRRLIDGFVTDPLPVSAAADASAVVALGFEAPLPKRVNGPSRLLSQVTSSMTNNLVRARLDAARAQGMRLHVVMPELERRIGLFDTDAMPYLVEVGRRAAEQNVDAIAALLAAPATACVTGLAA